MALWGVGINIVWTSPVLRRLKSNDTEANPLGESITTSQVALITGLMPLGGIISPFILTKLCDIIGRKKTIMAMSVLMMAAEIGLSFSKTIYLYYVWRFIIGISLGSLVSSGSIFLSELSEDHNRGTIGCFVGMSFPLGHLYDYLVGPWLSVTAYTLMCTIPHAINLICFFTFIPDSPVYLASKGNKEGALKALKILRNKDVRELEEEYEQIVNTLKNMEMEREPTWRSLLSVKGYRKGVIISGGLAILQQLSGICAILAFAGPLFDECGAALSGDMTAIMIATVQTICVSLATMVIERVGRRPLLLISTLGGFFPHVLLGIFFYLKKLNMDVVNSILWLPILCILVFIVTYSLGLGVIPTAIMSELFPSNVKSKTSSLCSFISIFLMLIITTLFPVMNDLLGPSWCLWIFGVFGFLGFLFVFFYVPEIKGKSVTEVQELLSK